MTEDTGPGEVEDYECCGKTSCPGTCDDCGFSQCPAAPDVIRCDC